MGLEVWMKGSELPSLTDGTLPIELLATCVTPSSPVANDVSEDTQRMLTVYMVGEVVWKKEVAFREFEGPESDGPISHLATVSSAN